MGGTIALIAASAIVSAISGYMGAEAQKQAYNALANATDEEKKMLQEEYDKAYGQGSYNAKMQEIGLGAAEDIQSLLANEETWNKYIDGEKAWQEYPEFSFTAEDLYSDPSYKTRLNEGLAALEQSLVAGGNADSGYAQKAINDYAQDQASKEYAAAYNRAYTNFNDERNFDFNAWKTEASQYYQNLQTQLAGLQGLSSQGQQANTNQTNALMTLAGQKANAGIQSATAQAAADQSQTSAYTSVLDALAKGLSTGAGVSMSYDKMNYDNGKSSSGSVANTTATTPTNFYDVIDSNSLYSSNQVIDSSTMSTQDAINVAIAEALKSNTSTNDLILGA